MEKNKIINILNSVGNSKLKFPNQIAKSKAQTHQTNEKQHHIPDLVQAFSYVKNIGLNMDL